MPLCYLSLYRHRNHPSKQTRLHLPTLITLRRFNLTPPPLGCILLRLCPVRLHPAQRPAHATLAVLHHAVTLAAVARVAPGPKKLRCACGAWVHMTARPSAGCAVVAMHQNTISIWLPL